MQSQSFNWRSYALGVFILFQLMYLPTANAIKLIALRLPESKGELDDDIQLRGRAFAEPLQSAADAVGTAFVRWGELTGQAQGWSLFAPVFGHQASLPATYFDGPTIASQFGHSNHQFLRHFRLPSSKCRLFNYEYRLALLYWTWSEEWMRDERDAWKTAAISRVRRQQRSLQAFMHWRLREYLAANPNAIQPKNITLYAQLTHNPPWESLKVIKPLRPILWMACIPLGLPTPPGALPVQAFDLAFDPTYDRGKFMWLPIEAPP